MPRRPGVHVTAVGAFRPTARELDEVTRGARLVVDERHAAFAEAGSSEPPPGTAELGECCRPRAREDLGRAHDLQERRGNAVGPVVAARVYERALRAWQEVADL